VDVPHEPNGAGPGPTSTPPATMASVRRICAGSTAGTLAMVGVQGAIGATFTPHCGALHRALMPDLPRIGGNPPVERRASPPTSNRGTQIVPSRAEIAELASGRCTRTRPVAQTWWCGAVEAWTLRYRVQRDTSPSLLPDGGDEPPQYRSGKRRPRERQTFADTDAIILRERNADEQASRSAAAGPPYHPGRLPQSLDVDARVH